MIILIPYGGLCNRLRLINSVYRLEKQKIFVIWKVNSECAISYNVRRHTVGGVNCA